jgi:3-hydroxyisobutyrate dehydrogenase
VEVSILGTGIMGAAMGLNLCKAGFTVSAWNRSRERTASLARAGARIGETPAAAVRGANLVLSMLSDGAAVEGAMVGRDGALAAMDPSAIWIQMSTVGVDATRRLFELAQGAGVAFVDAPVLGTRQPAEQGKLTILASGDPRLQPRCEQAFAAIGKRVLWLGEVGASSRLKLVANQWSTGMVALLAETVTLARTLGVDPADFFALVDGGDFSAPYAQTKGALMLRGEFPPSFPLDMARKDVGLVLEAAREGQQPLPITLAIERQYALAEQRGHGRQDLSSIIFALLEN